MPTSKKNKDTLAAKPADQNKPDQDAAIVENQKNSPRPRTGKLKLRLIFQFIITILLVGLIALAIKSLPEYYFKFCSQRYLYQSVPSYWLNHGSGLDNQKAEFHDYSSICRLSKPRRFNLNDIIIFESPSTLQSHTAKIQQVNQAGWYNVMLPGQNGIMMNTDIQKKWIIARLTQN